MVEVDTGILGIVIRMLGIVIGYGIVTGRFCHCSSYGHRWACYRSGRGCQFVPAVPLVTAASMVLGRIPFHILIGFINGVFSLSTRIHTIIYILWGEWSWKRFSHYTCVDVSS